MSLSNTDADWMRRALAFAREADAAPEKNPIGCVIVLNGRIIGKTCNEVDLRHDATPHAEILAIGRAGAALQCNELRDAVLYSTLRPCGMCTMASIWAKVGRIVYGASRDDVHEMYFEDRHLSTENFIRDAFKDDITWKAAFWRKNARLFTSAGSGCAQGSAVQSLITR